MHGTSNRPEGNTYVRCVSNHVRLKSFDLLQGESDWNSWLLRSDQPKHHKLLPLVARLIQYPPVENSLRQLSIVMHLANLPVIFLALVVSATALKLDIPKGRRDNGDDDISLRSRSFGHFPFDSH